MAEAKKSMSFLQFLNTAAILSLVGGVAYLGFSAAKNRIAAEIYEQKLGTMAADYSQVRTMYNQAVSKTAVTELVAAGKKLSVRVRTVAGLVKEIETPFDPSQEIYVDYVVLDGRLWIRRVFDSKTPPDKGLIIDPAMANVDWKDQPEPAVGKAVYRSLSDGRWVVTVTGEGALGLVKAEGSPELVVGPQVQEHKTITEDAAKEAQSVTPVDVWRWIRK